MLGCPVVNLAARVPRADFIHTQAGWEIVLLSIAKIELELSKTF